MNLTRFTSVLSLAALLAVPLSASAHRAWFLPASTTLSGEEPWVGVDAAVSNDIFHADYHALGLANVAVTGPDGSAVEMHNAMAGKHRSSFDLNLQQEGTYKIAMAMAGIMASWETEDGKRKRWPARGQRPDPAKFAAEVPKKAKNLRVVQRSRRIETFVTSGAPTTDVLAPTNIGLELLPVTHPNDLYQGETAQFAFLIDGEPAQGVQVTIFADGMRYRSEQEAVVLTSDAKGMVSITWPEAGMYLIEAKYQDNKAKKPAKQRMGGYFATLEVLPQ